MSKNERNFWLDGIMFLAFLITIVSGLCLWLVNPNSNPSVIAGIDRAVWQGLHVGSGLFGLLGVITHIVWHWHWLKALRGRSLKTLKRPVLANRVVDRLTWFAFISSNFFGILVWVLSASLPTGMIKIFEHFHVHKYGLVDFPLYLVFHEMDCFSIFRYQPFVIIPRHKGCVDHAAKMLGLCLFTLFEGGVL
jgi:hypothetical protein